MPGFLQFITGTSLFLRLTRFGTVTTRRTRRGGVLHCGNNAAGE
jgi:hypothetical protein